MFPFFSDWIVSTLYTVFEKKMQMMHNNISVKGLWGYDPPPKLVPD